MITFWHTFNVSFNWHKLMSVKTKVSYTVTVSVVLVVVQYCATTVLFNTKLNQNSYTVLVFE